MSYDHFILRYSFIFHVWDVPMNTKITLVASLAAVTLILGLGLAPDLAAPGYSVVDSATAVQKGGSLKLCNCRWGIFYVS